MAKEATVIKDLVPMLIGTKTGQLIVNRTIKDMIELCERLAQMVISEGEEHFKNLEMFYSDETEGDVQDLLENPYSNDPKGETLFNWGVLQTLGLVGSEDNGKVYITDEGLDFLRPLFEKKLMEKEKEKKDGTRSHNTKD